MANPNPTDLLGTEFTCQTCGRVHSVPLRAVSLTDDIGIELQRLGREHAPGPRINVISDARTRTVAGTLAEDALRQAGFEVKAIVVPDPAPGHSPVCDDRTRQALDGLVPAADLYVAAGSGVISDLTKWVAGDRSIPYITLATAASMNGYSSANVAPTINGLKCLVHGNGPLAIVTSLDILKQAPDELTAAGLGDVVAKGVSSADWRANHLLFDEYYCQFCVDLVKDIEPKYLQNPQSVRARSDEGMEALFTALVLTGIAMTVAGTSSPASGGEHLISHTLDMMSSIDGVPHDLHGRQVGVSTILAAALYEQVLQMDEPEILIPADPPAPEFWGWLAEPVREQHMRKKARWQQAADVLREPGTWQRLRTTLEAGLHGPKVFKDCLREAGAAHRVQDLGITRDRFLQALLHAHQMRERFTVLDLAWLTGVLPGRAEELVDRWVLS